MRLWTAAIALGALALAGRQLAAQADLEDKTPLTVSGFAVGSGVWDKNSEQNGLLASKIGLSLFRPWSDQLYLFAQLTTHLEEADSGPAETSIKANNLTRKGPRAKPCQLALSFGRFAAPVGCERDEEPLNLIPTT